MTCFAAWRIPLDTSYVICTASDRVYCINHEVESTASLKASMH